MHLTHPFRQAMHVILPVLALLAHSTVKCTDSICVCRRWQPPDATFARPADW